MLTSSDVVMAEWLKKYGQITAYTIFVITLTIGFVRLNDQILELTNKVNVMTTQMNSFQTIEQDRRKYERWLKSANSRLKRLYNRAGWEYEDIE